MTARPGDIQRFTYGERVLHWIVAAAFLYLLATGLAFSHPRLYWLTWLSGGGALARVLHPWVGLAFTLGMGAMLMAWARDMRVDAADRRWLVAVRAYATRDRERVPDAGKYNGGQKVFYWSMLVLAVAHLVSGVLLWFPQGAALLPAVGAGALNAMRLLHYGTTVLGGLLLIVHVYLGTLAYPGTLGAMIHGRVSRPWAALHHPRWKPDESS